LVSINWVSDSIDKNSPQLLNNYKIKAIEQPPDEELVEEDLPTPEQKAVDDLFDSEIEIINTPIDSSPPKKKTSPRKIPFKKSEDLIILKYVNEHATAKKTAKGTVLWKELEREKLITGHTWQSMKDRYHKYILRNKSIPIPPTKQQKTTHNTSVTMDIDADVDSEVNRLDRLEDERLRATLLAASQKQNQTNPKKRQLVIDDEDSETEKEKENEKENEKESEKEITREKSISPSKKN